jgi:hypothetical protein
MFHAQFDLFGEYFVWSVNVFLLTIILQNWMKDKIEKMKTRF